MSTVAIRKALEVRLNAMAPALPTSWENSNFKPVVGVAYQQVNLLFAQPDNPAYGPNFHRELGYMQVSLRYPLQDGPAPIYARAELIRAHFQRGLSLVDSGVTVMIEKTPEIGTGFIDADRFQVPVRIRWYSNINQ